MRFFFMLFLIVGAVVLAFRSCSSKLSPPKNPLSKATEAVKPGTASAEPAKSPSFSITSTASGEQVVQSDVPLVSSVYQFQHREAPGDDQLSKFSVLGVVCISDPMTRTVMVRGPKENLPGVMNYLVALDKMPGFCGVQTWVVFVDRSVTKGYDLTTAISSVVPDVNVATLGNGAFTLDLSSGDVAMALSVIADGTSVEVLQRPNVRLSHGTQARIESIQEVPIPMTTVSNGIAQTSINYRKVGLQLAVTPFFMGRSSVRLSVLQTNGLVGNTVEIEGNAIPTIQSQTVETDAQLTIGQTIILGGVTTQRLVKSKGFMRNITEVQEGSLYVILSTYNDVPRAVAVGSPQPPGFPGETVPLSGSGEESGDWIDNQILPPKTWLEKEREFIRRRGWK